MKKIKYFLSVVFFLVSVSYVSAATPVIYWKDMDITANYLKNTQEMKIAAELDGVTRIANEDYIMNLVLDGNQFQQTLQYDSNADTLSANFVNFTKKLATNYPISYTIKSSKNNTNVLYAYTGTLVFRGNTAYLGTPISQTGSTQTGSTGISSQSARDAEAIFTIVMQNLPKSLTNTQSKTNYLEDVIDTLSAYAVRYPNRKTVLDIAIAKFQKQILAYKNPSTKKTYIPKYKSKTEEPTTINGIGNSKTKNSWRVD